MHDGDSPSVPEVNGCGYATAKSYYMRCMKSIREPAISEAGCRNWIIRHGLMQEFKKWQRLEHNFRAKLDAKLGYTYDNAETYTRDANGA